MGCCAIVRDLMHRYDRVRNNVFECCRKSGFVVRREDFPSLGMAVTIAQETSWSLTQLAQSLMGRVKVM